MVESHTLEMGLGFKEGADGRINLCVAGFAGRRDHGSHAVGLPRGAMLSADGLRYSHRPGRGVQCRPPSSLGCFLCQSEG